MWDVLVVDDSRSVLRLCSHVLESSGRVRPTTAASGDEALERLQTQRFDAVLSDYRMGQTDGLQVLRAARRIQPWALRFMMTGYDSPDLRQAAEEGAGVHRFIEKPLDAVAFMEAVERIVVDLDEKEAVRIVDGMSAAESV